MTRCLILDPPLRVCDDQVRESLEDAQLKLQRERGTDLTMFSPRASSIAHHACDAQTRGVWSEICNELVHHCCTLYPRNFFGVCQLPQSPGVAPETCIAELARRVKEFGSVGCNLNADPSGADWKQPPLTDRWWYPLYEKMVELDVPAMVHVSRSSNPAVHTTGLYDPNADTTAFMQFLPSDLFQDVPRLKFVSPQGGRAVPCHWGRFRGLAQDMRRPQLQQLLLQNVCFDICVYDRPGRRAAAQGRSRG